MRVSRIAAGLFCASLVSLAVGCGGANPLGRKAVSGNVTLNGSPIENGSIEFSPLMEGGTQSGGLISGGSYAIEEDQGLAPGKYRVAIFAQPAAPELPPGHMPGDPLPPPPKEMVPPEWNVNSKETIEVTPDGPTEFSFAITSKR